MNNKLIFLDIDGTLVGYDAKIPPSALRALSMAQANGHRIFIASGRARGIVYPWLLEAFPFDGMITAGGIARTGVSAAAALLLAAAS